jgi:hypothetical protein
MIQRFGAAAIIIAGLFAAPSVQAQGDAADLNLWQMVQSRNTPADYQLYLQIFPSGKFAPLARIRAQAPAPVGTPAPAPILAPAPAVAAAPQQPPQPDPDTPQFTVTPAVARVGQKFTVNCGNLPSGGSFDVIVAVPAGSPAMMQTQGAQGIQMDYVANCLSKTSDGTFQLGPLPPGRWEFRWLTTLYNLENRPEVKFKVEVTVR